MNLYIPHNRRMPLQAEEALGPISIPQGSRGVDPLKHITDLFTPIDTKEYYLLQLSVVWQC